MSDATTAAILVLSDLHLGDDFGGSVEIPPLDSTPWARLFGLPTLERFIANRCIPHDTGILRSLPLYLPRVLADLRRQGHESGKFDACLLLGDLVTWPGEESYQLLRQYLTAERFEGSIGNSDVTCAGLNLPPESLIPIPGNHDKLLRTTLKLYQQHFAGPLELPSLHTKGSLLVSRALGTHEALFILVDANRYCRTELRLDWSVRNHLAGGVISRTLIRNVKTKLAKLRRGQRVDHAQLKDYDQAVKILLVHYAADVSRLVDLPGRMELYVVSHSCRNLDRLLEQMRSEVRLVIHGHLHLAGLYNFRGVSTVACTTTSQKGGKNGFFVLRLCQSGAIRADHHVWTGSGFTLDPDPGLNRVL